MPAFFRALTFAFGFIVIIGGNAGAATGGFSLVPNLAAMKWSPGPASLPKGTLIAVLAGDPSKPGPFVVRFKFPPNSIVPPHRHSGPENLTILAGTLYHEVGPTYVRNHGTRVTAGGFVYLPGGVPHTAWTLSDGVTLQVTGTGPFGVLLVDPKGHITKP